MLTAPDLVARLLYRDALVLILDKPAGLPVHRGPQSARGRGLPTLTDFLDDLRFGLPSRPEIAHRLDRETAGCLVLGRHRQALARLGALFQAHAVGKRYWAVVEGGPATPSGTIDLPIGKKAPGRGWWMRAQPQGDPALDHAAFRSDHRNAETVIDPHRLEQAWREQPESTSSQHALTHWQELGRGTAADGRALTALALEPVTGRTHQLRVHCAAMGWPILGDSIYGTAPRLGGPGLHLLARSLVLPLYARKPPIAATAGVPEHMAEALRTCGVAWVS